MKFGFNTKTWKWQTLQGGSGFQVVAAVVVLITLGAVWSIVHHSSVVEVSLRDIVASDLVPPGVLALFRLACAALALCTLLSVYNDQKGLELRYLDATVHLRRYWRWTTFTVWCFTLLWGYFTLALLCSITALAGYGATVPAALVLTTLVLFEISYAMSLLVTSVVTCVLIPAARRSNYPLTGLFRWRALIMHNGNVLMMQLALLLAPVPITLAHLPYAVLFGCLYAFFAWLWFWRTGVFYYFFLDYRRPYATLTYLGLFTTITACYGLGWLIAGVARHTHSRWWTYLCILLLTLSMTRFRAPAARTTAGAVTPVSPPLPGYGSK